jgi:hypothetical protein
MIVPEIDFENDDLIFYLEPNGRFHHYQWGHKTTAYDLQKMISEWNNDPKKHNGIMVKEITDNFLRDICAFAYKQYATARRNSADDADEVMEDIDNAVEQLETALENLQRIKGLR